MTTDTIQHGPMERAALAALAGPKGLQKLLQRAREQDAIRADLLAALEAISTLAHQYADGAKEYPVPYVNARWLVTTADAAIRKARGE